jgi:hypothetical protein
MNLLLRQAYFSNLTVSVRMSSKILHATYTVKRRYSMLSHLYLRTSMGWIIKRIRIITEEYR